MNPLDLLAADRTLWLMEPASLRAFVSRVSRVTEWPSPQRLEDGRRRAAAAAGSRNSRVGVIEVSGFIDQHWSIWNELFGGFSTAIGEAVLAQMVADPGVSAIVLHIDSGGGSAAGVQEFAASIRQARQRKPVVAAIDSLAGSAAYWIASAASEVVITPSGLAGSIGVYQLHQDVSAALAKDGVKVSIIQAGKYKAELSPYAPLSEDARDYLQRGVDQTYGDFVAGVARGRLVTAQTVLDRYGQGRMLSAQDALAAGMVDRIAPYTAVVQDLLKGGKPYNPDRYATAEVQHFRAEARRRAGEAQRLAADYQRLREQQRRADAEERRRERERLEAALRPKK